MLDFPVLAHDGGSFLDGVSYDVTARQNAGNLEITHTLKGQSFIRQLVIDGDAQFSVRLLYADSAERQHHSCDPKVDSEKNGAVTATQTIPIAFEHAPNSTPSYAPKIMPSIVLMREIKGVVVDAASGLTDFWEQGACFDLPKYARVALSERLKFDSGNVSNLFELNYDEALGPGEMKVSVDQTAGEGKVPVQLYCGEGVYNALKYANNADPENLKSLHEAVQSAIVTQALSATYAYMQSVHLAPENEGYEERGVLLAHLELLNKKGMGSWKDDPEFFNPSLVATKMWPYAVALLNGGTDDPDD